MGDMEKDGENCQNRPENQCRSARNAGRETINSGKFYTTKNTAITKKDKKSINK